MATCAHPHDDPSARTFRLTVLSLVLCVVALAIGPTAPSGPLENAHKAMGILARAGTVDSLPLVFVNVLQMPPAGCHSGNPGGAKHLLLGIVCDDVMLSAVRPFLRICGTVRLCPRTFPITRNSRAPPSVWH